VPVQVPVVAVSTEPWIVVPLTVGKAVFTGGVGPGGPAGLITMLAPTQAAVDCCAVAVTAEVPELTFIWCSTPTGKNAEFSFALVIHPLPAAMKGAMPFEIVQSAHPASRAEPLFETGRVVVVRDAVPPVPVAPALALMTELEATPERL
jgi:hypothetical protein